VAVWSGAQVAGDVLHHPPVEPFLQTQILEHRKER
jgi:hypothetical protein